MSKIFIREDVNLPVRTMKLATHLAGGCPEEKRKKKTSEITKEGVKRDVDQSYPNLIVTRNNNRGKGGGKRGEEE